MFEPWTPHRKKDNSLLKLADFFQESRPWVSNPGSTSQTIQCLKDATENDRQRKQLMFLWKPLTLDLHYCQPNKSSSIKCLVNCSLWIHMMMKSRERRVRVKFRLEINVCDSCRAIRCSGDVWLGLSPTPVKHNLNFLGKRFCFPCIVKLLLIIGMKHFCFACNSLGKLTTSTWPADTSKLGRENFKMFRFQKCSYISAKPLSSGGIKNSVCEKLSLQIF